VVFARRLLGQRRDYAEDVVQEALIRAHRALRRDDRPMDLPAWLFALTRNCCLDELRRVHADVVALDTPAAQRALVDPVSPETVVEGRAGLRQMLDGIADLPAEQLHTLIRREVDRASHREVAAELGITPQASRSLVFRARQSLVAGRRRGRRSAARRRARICCGPRGRGGGRAADASASGRVRGLPGVPGAAARAAPGAARDASGVRVGRRGVGDGQGDRAAGRRRGGDPPRPPRGRPG
jgi:RNA polymerase sigma factor (sigma-70 family)